MKNELKYGMCMAGGRNQMRKALIFAACLFLAGCPTSTLAGLMKHPNANILWRIDGRDMTAEAMQQWHTDGVDIQSTPGGGLMLTARGNQHIAGHDVPLDGDYPWLVCRIGKVNYREGYRKLQFYLLNTSSRQFGMVSYPRTGLFIGRLLPRGIRPPASARLRVAIYNTQIVIDRLQMVKLPCNRLEINTAASQKQQKQQAIWPGDEVTFRMVLSRPAEDVTLTFFDAYTMPQLNFNHQTRLQLHPEDKSRTQWSARVKLVSLTRIKGGSARNFEPGQLLFKATILGSDVPSPIWTWNALPFNFGPRMP